MTNSDKELADLAADYTRHRAAAIESTRAMSPVESTVTSPQGLVTVTVAGHGEVRALTFNSKDYRRMAPAELATVILETIAKARESAMRQMTAALPQSPLGGLNFQDMLNGRIDWEAVLPERLDVEGFVLPNDRRA